MNKAYIRVSTIDQNEERQIKAMEKENIQKYFTEKVNAKDAKRPKLMENDLNDKVGKVFDFIDVQRDVNKEIVENLNRIEVRVENNIT